MENKLGILGNKIYLCGVIIQICAHISKDITVLFAGGLSPFVSALAINSARGYRFLHIAFGSGIYCGGRQHYASKNPEMSKRILAKTCSVLTLTTRNCTAARLLKSQSPRIAGRGCSSIDFLFLKCLNKKRATD